jgi:hypothetical protein
MHARYKVVLSLLLLGVLPDTCGNLQLSPATSSQWESRITHAGTAFHGEFAGRGPATEVASGQTEKNSVGAYVFHFAFETRTLLAAFGMSQSGQQRTIASAQVLVGLQRAHVRRRVNPSALHSSLPTP